MLMGAYVFGEGPAVTLAQIALQNDLHRKMIATEGTGRILWVREH